MFIVKKTGLVPVKETKRGARTGVYGLPPDAARRGVAAGVLEYVQPGPHVEVMQIDPVDPIEEEPKSEVHDPGAVEIPDHWESAHPLTWIKIAGQILGGEVVLTDKQKQDEVKPSAVAKDIIVNEIQRRAAAESPTE